MKVCIVHLRSKQKHKAIFFVPTYLKIVPSTITLSKYLLRLLCCFSGILHMNRQIMHAFGGFHDGLGDGWVGVDNAA